MGNEKSQSEMKKAIRWEVFLPAFLVIGIAAVVGVINQEMLTKASGVIFEWTLNNFGWLYQISIMASFVLVGVATFSKFGKIRIGGKDAKPKYSFATWFAMALTGGIATGIVTWCVNEPVIYYGNVWGELNNVGIEPGTTAAAVFAMGRTYYNWTFIPYAIYAMCGLLVAYVYYHKKDSLTVTATLKPLFGNKVAHPIVSATVDTLSMLALAIGLATGLTMCITLTMTGLKAGYGIQESMPLFIGVGAAIICAFTFSSYVGLDKGLKIVGNLNAWFYYALIILLFVMGPTIFILRIGTAGLATWLHNFWLWGLDPVDIGGEALTRSWTLFDWAFWVAYAPVTGIFLALLSYGRTVREYMIVNWILPSVFGLVWFMVWGGNAIHMQMEGTVDLVGAINTGGAVMAMWEFLKHLPFGLGVIVLPVNILVILASFITCADATLTNIGSMCVRDIPIGTEPPAKVKAIWGISIGVVSIIMAAYGGGAQGVDGVKALSAAAGFVVLFIFAIQVVSFIKVFFIDKVEE